VTIKRIALFSLLLSLVAGMSLADERTIPRHKKIYIEKMPNDLDGYIRAEFTKQHIPLTVVLDQEQADLVMTGGSEESARKWHEGWLTAVKDHASGNISVIDPKAKAVLWSGEAGDRSLMWGNLARGGPYSGQVQELHPEIVGK
jgi:hypothetical protein